MLKTSVFPLNIPNKTNNFIKMLISFLLSLIISKF